MLRVAIAIALLLAVTPAQAGIRGCYERTYDKAHLAKNAGQLAARVMIQYGFTNDKNAGEEHQDYIFAYMRERKELFLNTLICTGGGSVLACKLDSDGGQVTLTEANGRLTIDALSPLKLFESGSSDTVQINIDNDSQNTTYSLKKTSKKLCNW